MRLLVTGDQGAVGRAVVPCLRHTGHEIVGFDLLDGCDVRDRKALAEAARGCDAVVHLAALLDGSDDAIFHTNVSGAWSVLQAARQHGLARVVVLSSANAMGLFMGQGIPDYLPLDEDHPCRPRTAYGVSKYLVEEMCRGVEVPTICLRAPGVFRSETYARIKEARRADASFEWSPYWEYGAFLDERDLAAAVLCALSCPAPAHDSLLLCASDISSQSKTALGLKQQILPEVEWRGGDAFVAEPYRALVDTTRARTVLNWTPRHTWR